ncbi:MAG: class I SAM-dependent methyltransferase [Actinomycetota bacterium]
MSSEHYFSQEPSSSYHTSEIIINLGGEQLKVQTASGTFSPKELDLGTEVLLDRIDLAPKTGNILDLGCGWGPISIALAKHSPKATIWAVDVNSRSLEMTQKNAASLGLENIKTSDPDSFPQEISFTGIWSNPPIRVGKAELHSMLLHWLPKLEKSGCAYLVVQKHLGSDSLIKWLDQNLGENFEVSRLDSVKTYRIIKVLKRS